MFNFSERPQYFRSQKLKNVLTPKNKQTQVSLEQIVKTQPDERTTAQNHSKNSQMEANLLESRLFYIEKLAETLNYKSNRSFEIQKILSSLQEIAKTLNSISRTEIDLNLRNKQLEQATLESLQQKQTIQKLKDYNSHIKQDYHESNLKLNLTYMDQNKAKREVLQLQRINEEQFKKIKALEKRIEMMLEKNLQTKQDDLRITLAGLISDNEQLKRDLIKKEKENERFKELNAKLIQQNAKLSKKLDSLKTKKVGAKQEQVMKEEINSNYNYAFDPNSLPSNLDYRLSSLQSQEQDFILDLIEHGSDIFTNQIQNLESQQQKKELISLVSSQFVSIRNFSEKINQIMSEFIIMISYKSIQNFQIHLSKAFKQIFATDIVQLWIIDGMTCRAETYDSSGNHLVALLTKGVFSQLVFQDYGIRSPSSESQLLYITENKEHFAKDFLLLPIMGNSRKPCGILEIQNLPDKMQLDAQYFGLLINMLSKSVIQSILDYQALEKELKYRDFFHQGFVEMCMAESQKRFQECVEESAYRIFSIAQTRFLLVEGNQFLTPEGRTYKLCGCAYQVMKCKNARIVTHVTKEQHFDENVDISSILPVFAGPIIVNEQVVAVVEFIIKRKQFIADKHPFGNQANIGFRLESADRDAEHFYELVQKAYVLFLQKPIKS